MSMIDWVSARVRCSYDGLINDGKVFRVDRDGVYLWDSDAWLSAEGSHSSTVKVRGSAIDGVGWLDVSGNPSKFLQGHNVFGSNNLRGLMPLFLDALVSSIGLTPTQEDRESWSAGRYWLTRIDIARMLDLGSPELVRRVLAACLPIAKGRHQSTTHSGSTVYVGQHSKLKTTKVYDKLVELGAAGSGHGFHESIPVELQSLLREYASGCLRVEQTVRGGQLDLLGVGRMLRWGTLWGPSTVEGFMSLFLEDIELNDTMKLKDDVAQALPGKLLGVYDMWRAGRDLRALYSRTTFFRYRAQLLPYGVDISLVRPREVVRETEYLLGAPLRSFFSSAEKPVPSWAVGTSWLVAV